MFKEARETIAHKALVRQTVKNEDRISNLRSHSWLKTLLMANPITAPVVIVSEMMSGKK